MKHKTFYMYWIRLVLLIIFIPLIIFMLIFLLLWAASNGATKSFPDPLKPAITYAEFPFRLEYTLNDEHIVVEDVWICEYDGIKISSMVGKSRKWKGYLASGNKEIVLFQLSEINKPVSSEHMSNSRELVTQTVVWLLALPSYYMGDEEKYGRSLVPPNIVCYEEYDDGYKTSNTVFSDELNEDELYRFGIEIISWRIADPIVNKFE